MRKIEVLTRLDSAKSNYEANQDSDTLAELQKRVVELELIDKHFFKEWYKSSLRTPSMKAFCDQVMNERKRLHPDWMVEEVIELQRYFSINPIQQSLEDFNRV